MAERECVRAVVTGRVQGVGFRAFTRGHARELGVDGWVRNRIDGSVELVAAGSRDAVAALIDRLHQGPPASRVDGVETEAASEAAAVGDGFSVRR